MKPPQSEKGAQGLDLMLTTLAVVMAMFFIPMIFEFAGGSSGRALLLATLILPPAVGLGLVHWRDGAPPSAPARVKGRSTR